MTHKEKRKRGFVVYNCPDGFAWRRCGDDDNDDGKGERIISEGGIGGCV